jgi:hypothetical protein
MRDDFGTSRASDTSNSKTVFFLDSASLGPLFFTFFLLVSINIVHVAVSRRCPSLFSLREDSIALAGRTVNRGVELDLIISNLRQTHAFIALNCTLIRRHTTLKASPFILDASSRVTFSKNFATTMVVDTPRAAHRLSFPAGSLSSSAFSVLKREVSDFDTLDVKLSLSGALDLVRNASFLWSFVNPAAIGYIRSVRGLMSFVVLFMVFLFCFFLVFDAGIFTQTFCLVLGLAGVFASNPIAVFFPSGSSNVVSDHVLVATHNNVFRFFCLIQFEIMRRNKAVPNPLVFLGLGVFFAFAVTIDASASFDRIRHPMAATLESERVRLAVSGIYAAIALVWVGLGIVQSKSETLARRAFVFGFFLAGDLVIGLLVQFQVVAHVTAIVIQSTVPISMGAFAIFLLHTTARQEYQQMKEGPNIGGSLDVEELTPEADQEFEEDEEEFLEEEDFEEDFE